MVWEITVLHCLVLDPLGWEGRPIYRRRALRVRAKGREVIINPSSFLSSPRLQSKSTSTTSTSTFNNLHHAYNLQPPQGDHHLAPSLEPSSNLRNFPPSLPPPPTYPTSLH